MKQQLIATAALLATTLLANTGAIKLAQAEQLAETPVTEGLEASQNSDHGGGKDKSAAMLLVAGGVVALGSAASSARKVLNCYKPSSRTTHFQPQGKDEPETTKEVAKALTLNWSGTASDSERGYAHLKQGDALIAIENFNEAIRLNPQNSLLYSERANFRIKRLGDKQGAIEDYTKAIHINPYNALFYMWRSQTYHSLGNAQRAIEDYNKAIHFAPEDTMYYGFQDTVNLTKH